MTRTRSRRTATPATSPALYALRGAVPAKPYDSRAASRATANPDCGTLPVLAAMGISPDVIAEHAFAVGVGPDPRRSMSQLARQQGDTYDANVLTDGRPLLQVLQADGYLDATTIVVVNVNDHVNPPTAGGLTGTGGKPTKQQWRHYHQQRERYTRDAHARALAAPTPDVAAAWCRRDKRVRRHAAARVRRVRLRDCLPARAFHRRRPRGAWARRSGRARRHHRLGDAKSWRKLGRLDNGDKRAAVAIQIALYSAAATTTWPAAQAATVRTTGLVVNPPSTGGLATAKLTRIDLSDPLRALHAAAERGTDSQRGHHADHHRRRARGTSRLGEQHSDHRRDQHTARVQRLEPELPQPLPTRPDAAGALAANDDSTTRLGALATQLAAVPTVSRLHALQAGASPTPSEAEVAAALATGADLLGPPVSLPWATPAIPARPRPKKKRSDSERDHPRGRPAAAARRNLAGTQLGPASHAARASARRRVRPRAGAQHHRPDR